MNGHVFYVDGGALGEIAVPGEMTLGEVQAMYALWREPTVLPTYYWSQSELDDVMDSLNINAHDVHLCEVVQ